MRHHHLTTKSTPPTFEDLLTRARDLPEGWEGHILDGAVHANEPPSAARAHALAEISAMLVAGSSLGDPVPEAWSFLFHVEIAIRDEGFVMADAAGFRVGRGELAGAATPVRLVPAWVGEVLGGGARGFTLTGKRRAWAEIGVGHLWIADPEAQVLEIYENHRGKWLLLQTLADEDGVSVPPFEELHFDAGDLWLPSPSKRGITPPPSSAKRH